MGFGDQARLRFRDPRIGQVAAGALINRVVDRTDERVGHIPRIPAQRRPVRFDKGRIRAKRCKGQLLGFVEDDAGSRRLADARRSVEEQVLRIDRR